MVKSMRKVRTAKVVRVQMDKTAVVEMVWKQRNRLYRKQVRRVARFHVHDQLNQCQMGDVVRIEEVRPISKTKRWRLMEILERHVVAEVRPIELESDAEVLVAAEPLDEEGESAPEDLAEVEEETTDDESAVDDDVEEEVAPPEEDEDESLPDDEEIGEDDTPQGVEDEDEDKAGDEEPAEVEDEVK